MGDERLAYVSHPTPQTEKLSEESFFVRRMLKQSLVEVIDVRLNVFDRLEVTVELPIQHHRQEAGSIEGPKTGLTVKRLIERVDQIQFPNMECDDPIGRDETMQRDRLALPFWL